MSGRYEIVSTRTSMQKRLLCAPLWLAGASGCSAFAQLKKIVIGEADHISRSPLAVIRWRKSHFCIEPNGGFHEASVEFRVRVSRGRVTRFRKIAFAFRQPFRWFSFSEKLYVRYWRQQAASGRGI